jgi:HSP20 family protein
VPDLADRSEFSYGSFVWTIAPPAGADEDGTNAGYDRGILPVSVPLSGDDTTQKRVKIIGTTLVDENAQPELEPAEQPAAQQRHQPA